MLTRDGRNSRSSSRKPKLCQLRVILPENGKFDLIALSGGTGGMGEVMFGLMDTCCRAAVGMWTDVWAFKKLRLI